jgi:hypothetical protein
MVDHRKGQKNIGSKRFMGLILLFILFVWIKNNNWEESSYLTILGM